MTDRATANLPSNDLDATAAFYEALGFTVGFKDDGWMILSMGSVEIEFVPVQLNPRESIASCCLRVDNLDALYAQFAKANLPTDCWQVPRISEPKDEPWGMRMFNLIDLDGSLIRCIQN